jgi:ArsR family transcriptional regulator
VPEVGVRWGGGRAFTGCSLDLTTGRSSDQCVLTSQLADGLLPALADPLRSRIVELLADEQLCTCHIVELTGAGQINVSNHLRVLRHAGLVETEQAGRYTYYRLRPGVLESLSHHYRDLADRAAHAVQIRRPCS